VGSSPLLFILSVVPIVLTSRVNYAAALLVRTQGAGGKQYMKMLHNPIRCEK